MLRVGTEFIYDCLFNEATIIFFYIELESLRTTGVSKTKQMETKLNSLNLQMEEFKKIEELRISSSHDSEVIKYHRDAAVQFSYMIPVTG